MQTFRDQYLGSTPGKLLEVGSLDVNGTYRTLFDGWDYLGLDIVCGPGVDLMLGTLSTYDWPLVSDSIDVVISGSAFEHIEHPYATMSEIARVLKPGAYCCIIAPSAGPVHHEPDYRRYTETMMAALCAASGLGVAETWITPVGLWQDCVLIAKKTND